MGAYENALVEEGSRDELVRHFLLARQELAAAEARVAELEKAIKPFAAAPYTPAWQPIETAPTDGTEVLVFTRRKDVLFARFVDGEWWGLDPLLDCPWAEIVAGVLTHWMPLPEPPHLAFNEA